MSGGPFDPSGHYGIIAMARIMFDRSPKWWSENRHRLYAIGFPRPISPFGHPRWSGEKLNAWHGRDPAHDIAPDAPAVLPPNVTSLRAILKQRAENAARKQA